ncbi:1,4-alpha-glucan branching enzyme GlgB [Gemmatimonadetes bacterium T265]|nr:1,4-alpha-glucan branching enzyme GlgB [Gemmatimonadetes bacterium T265]
MSADEIRTSEATPAAAQTPIAVAAPHASPYEVARLTAGRLAEPHALLGAHPAEVDGLAGVVVRAWHPEAVRAECVLPPQQGDVAATLELRREAPGFFAAFLPGETLPLRYRLRFHFPDGAAWTTDDAYRFLPTLGDVDLYLIGEGTHRRLWTVLGAHPRAVDGTAGVAFAVWAPNAQRVSVVGDFCRWDGRRYPMRRLGSAGVWELFVPGLAAGARYEYELITREGALRRKTDPLAFKMEQAPGTASLVVDSEAYAWGDASWLAARPSREPLREAMAIYEVHLGSWMRDPRDPERLLTYRELAPRLAEHARAYGFTHVELLPVAEHPFYGSWGYQVTGFYAPTSRYGTPDDFRFLVDTLHQVGVGVIVDWVPAHFPKDDHALRRFDGTALYEHADPRLGEHPDWGTLIFNYGRHEVRNFLLANALYWLQEFHVDGLRVDAVASMLYLDYSRQAGQWLPNRYGGRENLEAIDFLRAVNTAVAEECPGCFTVAEESTAWPAVTKPAREGGLGFTFKWNMGWMHDTLEYFAEDPLYRRYHHDRLTFAMMYEYGEHFIMPLSHDEVVHLKGSLLHKMPGDPWRRLANLRLLLAYQYTRPGKKLLFMGTELAPWGEWNHDAGLDWASGAAEPRAAFGRFVRALGALYGAEGAFWRLDHEPWGFTWVDVNDRDQSVVSYVRRGGAGDATALVVLNLTPVVRPGYRVGAPVAGTWRRALTSDDAAFGGSGFGAAAEVATEAAPYHGHAQSVRLDLPPLGAVVYLAPAAPEDPPAADAVAAEASAADAPAADAPAADAPVTGAPAASRAAGTTAAVDAPVADAPAADPAAPATAADG